MTYVIKEASPEEMNDDFWLNALWMHLRSGDDSGITRMINRGFRLSEIQDVMRFRNIVGYCYFNFEADWTRKNIILATKTSDIDDDSLNGDGAAAVVVSKIEVSGISGCLTKLLEMERPQEEDAPHRDFIRWAYENLQEFQEYVNNPTRWI